MLIILLYILLSLLAVSLWINIGLWREVKRLELGRFKSDYLDDEK